MTIIKKKCSQETIVLLVLRKNTWNHTAVYKLFVLDKNTWYLITMCKKSLKNTNYKKCKYKCKRTTYLILLPQGLK